MARLTPRAAPAGGPQLFAAGGSCYIACGDAAVLRLLSAAKAGRPVDLMALARTLEHEPIDAEMWSRVGALLLSQGETTRGAAAFRIALRLDPNHSKAHRQLATVLAAHGSSAEAAAHYERFLDLTDTARQETRPRPTETLILDRGEERDLGTSDGMVTVQEDAVDIQPLRTQAADPPVVKLVNYALNRAAADGASDIHVEAYEGRSWIRSAPPSPRRACAHQEGEEDGDRVPGRLEEHSDRELPDYGCNRIPLSSRLAYRALDAQRHRIGRIGVENERHALAVGDGSTVLHYVADPSAADPNVLYDVPPVVN